MVGHSRISNHCRREFDTLGETFYSFFIGVCNTRREWSSCSRHEVEMDYGYSELQFSPAVGMKDQRKGEVLRDAVASDTEAVWEGALRDQKIKIKYVEEMKKKKYVEEM